MLLLHCLMHCYLYSMLQGVIWCTVGGLYVYICIVLYEVWYLNDLLTLPLRENPKVTILRILSQTHLILMIFKSNQCINGSEKSIYTCGVYNIAVGILCITLHISHLGENVTK